MTLELIRGILGWCTLLHFGLLLLWTLTFVFAHGWLYRLHGRLFPMPENTFNAIHYAGLAGYKLAVLVFAAVPWLALHLVG